jgi:hypothetical protein
MTAANVNGDSRGTRGSSLEQAPSRPSSLSISPNLARYSRLWIGCLLRSGAESALRSGGNDQRSNRRTRGSVPGPRDRGRRSGQQCVARPHDHRAAAFYLGVGRGCMA